MSIIAGIDIGTHSLKIAVAKRNQERGELEILGLAEESSRGVRKGSVVDPEELTARLLSLKQRIENITSQKLREVLVNIGGSHLSLMSCHGIVAVSRADGQISKEDVDRVLAAAHTFPVPSNNEIIDLFPQQFFVDGAGENKKVAGMKGMRLEADVLALCAFSPYVANLTNAVLGADLDIVDVIPSPLMADDAVLTPRHKELGVVLLNIGAGTTSLAVFEEGDLIHVAVFPVGSANITNDIAIGLQIDHDVAERVKLEFGTCGPQGGKRIEKIEVPDTGTFSFSPRKLSHIVEARMREIFQFVQKELKGIDKQGRLPGGAVLVGGGSKLPRLVEFAKKELKLPVRLGTPQGFLSFETDPVFLGVMGLVVRGFEQEGGGREVPPATRLLGKLKKFFKIFVP